MKEKLKRLNVEVPESLHWELKRLALMRNVTISFYVKGIISEQIIKENQFQDKSGKSER